MKTKADRLQQEIAKAQAEAKEAERQGARARLLAKELLDKMSDGLPGKYLELLEKLPLPQQYEWLAEHGDSLKPKANLQPLVFEQPKEKPKPRLVVRRGPTKDPKGDLRKMEQDIQQELEKRLDGLYKDGDRSQPLHTPARIEQEREKIIAEFEAKAEQLETQAKAKKQQAEELRLSARQFDPMLQLASSVEMSKAHSLLPFVKEDVAAIAKAKDFKMLHARLENFLDGDRVKPEVKAMAVLWARYVEMEFSELLESPDVWRNPKGVDGKPVVVGPIGQAVQAFMRLKAAIGGAAANQKRQQAAELEAEAAKIDGLVFSLKKQLETGRSPKTATAKVMKENF